MFALLILVIAVIVIFTSEVSSLNLLFSLLILMLYIIPYFTLWDDFKKMSLISESGGEGFIPFIFLTYTAFIVGAKLFDIMNTGASRLRPTEIIVNHKKYENYSIIVGFIGLAGYGYFILRSGDAYFYGHNSGDFSVGGYIYELRYFIFSAFLLLFQSYLNKTLSKKGLYFLIGISLFLAYDAYIQQQRGSWIRFGVIVLLSFLFHERSYKKIRITSLIVRHKKLFVLGLCFAFLLTFTLQVRKFYSPNTSFLSQISATVSHIADQPDVFFGGSGVDEGNEFVTAYNAYRSNVVAKSYDYGYKWLYPFLNFIPRNLWKDKPTWFTFSNDVFATMDKYVVFGHTTGSAETGIIDAFYRFFDFTPLFFLFFGFITKRLHEIAKDNISVRLFYICFFVGFFYFITQNMLPLVIFTLYMYIPVWYVMKKTTRKANYA